MQDWFLDRAKDIGIGKYLRRIHIAAEFDEVNGKPQATAFFGAQGYHSPSISLSYCLNALARYFTNSVS